MIVYRTSKVINTGYNESYRNNPRHFVLAPAHVAFLDRICDLVTPEMGSSTVVEVGSGQGDYIAEMRKKLIAAKQTNYRFLGLDAAIAGVEQSDEKYPDIEWANILCEDFADDYKSFDLPPIKLVIDKTGSTGLKSEKSLRKYLSGLKANMRHGALYAYIASRDFYEKHRAACTPAGYDMLEALADCFKLSLSCDDASVYARVYINE